MVICDKTDKIGPSKKKKDCNCIELKKNCSHIKIAEIDVYISK